MSLTIFKSIGTEYIDYHVQYFYVVDQKEKLVGVLRMHDMLFPTRGTQLDQIMLSSPSQCLRQSLTQGT